MTFHVTLDDRCLAVAPGENLLERLLRAGIAVAHGCRSGVCRSCQLRVERGNVPPEAQRGLSSVQRAAGEALACRFAVDSDLVLARPNDGGGEYAADLIECSERAPQVFRLRLNVPDGFEYRAGQYVTLWRDAHTCRAYSLASLPGERFLEFHVRRYDHGAVSEWLCGLTAGCRVTLRGPLGDCCYVRDEPDKPLLLAGQGTGLAPLWGIARAAHAAGHRGEVHLLHGVRSREHAYLDTELRELAASWPALRYRAVTGDAEALARAVLERASTFAGWTGFLCGAPATVSLLSRKLFLAGMASSDIFTDPFLPQA